MKYQVITLNGHPAIAKCDDMDGQTLKPGALFAPFGFNTTAIKACDALNSGGTKPDFFEWFKNDTNPSQPQPK